MILGELLQRTATKGLRKGQEAATRYNEVRSERMMTTVFQRNGRELKVKASIANVSGAKKRMFSRRKEQCGEVKAK